MIRLWNYLLERIGNPYGVAGLMGNLKAESDLKSVCLEKKYRERLGMTSEEYTQAVDSAKYRDFSTDSAGYGLAQWTYKDHKAALLKKAVSEGKSIGDYDLQMAFLWEDFSRFTAVLRTCQRATDVKTASDDVLCRYEKPKDQSESAKAKRAVYGEEIYRQCIMQSEVSGMVKAKELNELFRKALDEGWGYIWGKSGQVWTKKEQEEATRPQTVQYGSQWIGKRVADCSGLGYWAFIQLGGKMYHGSNTMWNKYVTHRSELVNGRRADGEEIWPGDPVFMKEDQNGQIVRHHVGYYVGNGQVIEAQGTRTGVVTNINGGAGKPLTKWEETAHWLNVLYENGVIYVKRPTLRKGDTGEDVKDMQTLLNINGLYGLTVDGKFGNATEIAVRDFQRAHGLTVDGVCGQKTWDALEDTPEPTPALETVEVRKTELAEVRKALYEAIEKINGWMEGVS